MPTVTIRSVTTTTDELGNSTTTSTDTAYPYGWPTRGGILLAPRSSEERTDPSVPAVITSAQAYGPAGATIDADDVLIVSGHSAAMDGEWRIEGRPGVYIHPSGWHAGFEVALKRAG